MGWIRRETEKGTTQYICPNCHDYHEFREDFGEQTFSENFIFCRRCGARNGTGTAPTLTPPNEWVNRVRELDELYTKLQIVTGFTAEQLLEIFAAGYTLEKPDYSKKFAEMENLAEAAQPNEPLTMRSCGSHRTGKSRIALCKVSATGQMKLPAARRRYRHETPIHPRRAGIHHPGDRNLH